MRIKALANGHVIEADDEAAKILIENKIYVDAGDEPITNSVSPTAVQPMTTADFAPKPKRGKSKK